MHRFLGWLLLAFLLVPTSGWAADPHLPEVGIEDLEGVAKSLPSEMGADRRIVILSFQRSHTKPVKAWMAFAQLASRENPGVDWFHIPVMGDLGAFSRSVINAAMRSEYKSAVVRARVFPKYGPTDTLLSALQIDDTSEPVVVLLDARGVVTWRWVGSRSEAGESALREALMAPSSSDPPPPAASGPWTGFPDYAGATHFCDGHVSGPPGAPHIQWDAYATADSVDAVRGWYREQLGADDDGTWRVPADTPDRVLSVDAITDPGPHTACEAPSGAVTAIMVSRMTR